jgi:hypothetical protein
VQVQTKTRRRFGEDSSREMFRDDIGNR